MFFQNWLNRLGQRCNFNRHARRRRSEQRIPVSVEVCESRQLPAANIVLSGGVVTITGNGSADKVDVVYQANQQQVKITHRQGSATETQTFAASAVTSLEFMGQGGNDVFTNNTNIPSRADGGAGNDQLTGGTGNDTLIGGAGNDNLLGKGGDDSLSGGIGNDSLVGDIGHDALEGNVGNDTLSGGDGDDVYYFRSSENLGQDTVKRDRFGNDDLGSNGLNFSELPTSVVIDLSKTTVQHVSSNLKLKLENTGAIDEVVGTRFADRITGNHLANFVTGAEGDDTLMGGGGNDNLTGEAGNDSLNGGAGDDRLTGDVNDDTLRGGDGNDELIGGAGADLFAGEAGQDRIMPQAAADELADAGDRREADTSRGTADLLLGTFATEMPTSFTTLAGAASTKVKLVATGTIPAVYRDAVNTALEFWSSVLQANRPNETITVQFSWSGRNDSYLAIAAPTDSREIHGRYFPIALANHRIGRDDNGVEAEGTVAIDGTDFPANATTVADNFAALVTHELGHVMGFTNLLDDQGNFQSTVETFLGIPLESTRRRIIDQFTRFLVDGTGQMLERLNPAEIRAAVRGKRGGLFWNGDHAIAANGGNPVAIHAAADFSSGSNVSHVDETTFPFQLMSPVLDAPNRSFTNTLTAIETGILEDLGWSIRRSLKPVNDPPIGEVRDAFQSATTIAQSSAGLAAGLPIFDSDGDASDIIGFNSREATFRDVSVGNSSFQFRDGVPNNAGYRFRAAQAVALASGFVGGIPTLHETLISGSKHYGVVLFNATQAETRWVSRADLGTPDEASEIFAAAQDYAVSDLGQRAGYPTFRTRTENGRLEYEVLVIKVGQRIGQYVADPHINNDGFGDRFRKTNDLGARLGFSGAFPNFHQATVNGREVRGTLLLEPFGGTAKRDVFRHELGYSDSTNVGARFRATHDYAVRNGFVGGFPNFHEAGTPNGVVDGTLLLESRAAERRDVKSSDLGNPGNGQELFRAVHDYAVRNGFVGGFPNFHRTMIGGQFAYVVVLIKQGGAQWFDAPLSDLENRPPNDVFEGARDQGRLFHETKVINGRVGDTDPVDFYSFVYVGSQASPTGPVTVRLSGLNADLDVKVLLAPNAVVTSSTRGGTNNEDLTFVALNGVRYFIQVFPFGSSVSDYRLEISV